MSDLKSSYESMSQFRMALRRLRKHRLAMLGCVVLGVLYTGAIFADFIAPYHYDNEKRTNSYNPPTALHFFDEQGKFHLIPFVYDYSYEFNCL